MHSKTHFPSHPFGLRWDLANLAVTLMVVLLFIVFVLLFLSLVASTAQAQASVPPTARQAGTMPQFVAINSTSTYWRPIRMAKACMG